MFEKFCERLHMQPSTLQEEIKTFITVTIGSLIYCAAIVLFVKPAKLPAAGVTGLSLMLNYVWNVPLGISTAGLNLGLFIYAYKVLPRRFFYWSAYSTAFISAAMGLMAYLPVPAIDDRMLLVIVAAVLQGASLALIFSVGASSGGFDIITMAIKRRTGMEIGSVAMGLSFAIILLFSFIVPVESVVYGLLMAYISSMVMNGDLRSFSSRKEAMIITNQTELVRNFIVYTLHRGVTIFNAHGGFDASPRDVIITLLTTHQALQLKLFLKKNDPAAFMRLSVAAEVLGNGFQKWEQE